MTVAERAARIAAAAEEKPTRRLTFKAAEDVAVVPPVFLWDGWLARSSIHLLIGRQSAGKSTFAAWVATHVNLGLPLPGDTTSREPGKVALLSLEEPDDRLVARMTAAGADLERVLVLGDVQDLDDEGRPFLRPWRLPADCSLLEELIVAHRIDLVSIDGLGYAVGGDSHNYANVGSALSALRSVAERTGCAILGLTHPPKGSVEAVTAAIGSTAWTSVPRVCWVLGKDPDDDSGARRVVSVSKTNFRQPATGWSFTIADDSTTGAGFVHDVRPSAVDADRITTTPDDQEERSEQAEIASVLLHLAENGPVALDDARKYLRAAGYEVSDKTIQRARKRAGLEMAPPGRFGGRRSFGRPEHFQSGHAQSGHPSSLAGVHTVSTLSDQEEEGIKVPSNASVDTPRPEGSTLSRQGGDV